MKTYKIKSYAKINLYLEVLKKRRDNYHQIITLFERISLCDEIYLKPRQDKAIRIKCNYPDIPKGKTNLTYRAASLLKKDFGINKGVDIKINKRIPPASGLGGGSSNAASVLLGLNRLWKLNLSKEKLISYGKKLGCDVPFFLSNIPFALGFGRGDEIKAVTTVKKRFWHILAVPKIKVSTKKVYTRLDKILKDRTRRSLLSQSRERVPAFLKPNSLLSEGSRLTKPITNVKILTQVLKKGKIPLIKKSIFNRLKTATFNLYPELKRLKNIMLDLGIEAISMSGSGPAMFGIVSSRKEASVLCRKLSRFREWDIFLVRTS